MAYHWLQTFALRLHAKFAGNVCAIFKVIVIIYSCLMFLYHVLFIAWCLRLRSTSSRHNMSTGGHGVQFADCAASAVFTFSSTAYQGKPKVTPLTPHLNLLITLRAS